MNRHQFIKSAATGGIFMTALPLVGMRGQDESQLDKKLVQEFVGQSHKDLTRVKELLQEYPTLLNAAHDWKYGDFETGLGAASHVGNKDIIEYLLNKGAQMNIFTACVMGKTAIVKLMLEAFPETLHAKGPHGFTLLHHAEKGGETALEVKGHLIRLGAKETKIALY